MKAKSIVIVVIVFAICVGILFLVPIYCAPRPNMSRTLTVNEIHECYTAIRILEDDQRKSLKEIIAKQATTENLNRTFTLLLQTNNLLPSPIGGRRTQVISPELVDAWGKPLEIRWREGSMNSRYSFLETNINSPVIIWSFGPNGTNNFGEGDDVVWFNASKRSNSTSQP